MKAQAKKTTTVKKIVPKKVTTLQIEEKIEKNKPVTTQEYFQYYDTKMHQMMPSNDQFIDKVFATWHSCAHKDPKLLDVGTFCSAAGILRKSFYDWLKKDPTGLRNQLHDDALEAIGRKLKLGALDKSMSEKSALFFIRAYSEEARELYTVVAKESDFSSVPKTIIIDRR